MPVVATCHTPPGEYLAAYPRFVRAVAWHALRWFYRRCAEVYVPASAVADDLRRNAVPATIVETPPGVNAEQFHPGRRSREWRHAMGIADGEAVVAFAVSGSCGPRLTMLAEVLRELAADGLKFRTLVLGNSHPRAEVRAKPPDALFAGARPGDELASAVASADLFLDTAEGGAVECGTLEAMAGGVPVVAADSATNRDVVRNGVDGIVCRPDDRAGFALVVRRLVENPAARENLRKAALRRAAGYHRDVLLGDMLENYNRVLRRWPLRPRW